MAPSASSLAASASSPGRDGGDPPAAAAAALAGKDTASTAACRCAICLESFKDEAYLDTCFHSFCYKCICQWEPRKRRLSDAYELVSQFYNMKEITSNVSGVQQYWEQHKYLGKKFWLETWLRREIQALTRDENVDTVMYHIHGVIESFMKRLEKEHKSKRIPPEKRKEEFRTLLSDAARPFLLGRTERFVTEVELFLASNLNMETYNKLRVQRFRESNSSLTREQDALPHES
ncbi:hypothetical protein HU200_018600 [Digitaria exilis]|uniref:RING-type domain-containing protein n=1 Tax=Digitaria exilis TaxID=1010633 RepID=A0A835F4G6_9POAL|nr:hypothetical protein HU200_018600 [Digitaria exilis]